MPHITVLKEMLSHSTCDYFCWSRLRQDGTTEFYLVSCVVRSPTMKTEAGYASEISTHVYQTAWRLI
jgi:hypothetical protein